MPNVLNHLRTESRTCNGAWATVTCRNPDCSCQHKAQPRWLGGCDSAHCTHEECNNRWSSARARKARLRLTRAGKTGLAYVVLTLPEQIYSLLQSPEALRSVRRTAYRFLETWAHLAHKVSEGHHLGGLCTFHPTGDNLEVFQPHLNMVYPLRAVTPNRTAWVNLKYHVEEEDLQALCRGWTAQCREWGYTGAAPVQVNYEFRQTERQIMHTLGYVLRAFPTWSRSITYLSWWGAYSSRQAALLPKPPDVVILPDAIDPLACEECGDWLRLDSYAAPRGPPVKRARIPGQIAQKNWEITRRERQKYAHITP